MKNYNSYNNSSAAYDYEQYYEIKRRTILKRIKKKTKFVRNTDKKLKISIFTTFIIVLFLFCSFYVLDIMAGNIALKRSNTALANELRLLRGRTNELIVELNSSIDLSEIETIARSRLRMGEPSVNQIVEINVPRDSYVIFSD